VILQLLGTFVANLFTSRRRLEVENLFLRHQLNIALRRAPHRLQLRGSDRALLVWTTRFWPSLLGLSRVIQPGTILRWRESLPVGTIIVPHQISRCRVPRECLHHLLCQPFRRRMGFPGLLALEISRSVRKAQSLP
jgi:hypothetical protein